MKRLDKLKSISSATQLTISAHWTRFLPAVLATLMMWCISNQADAEAFVSVGNNGTGTRSVDDGATWIVSNPGNGSMRGITSAPGRLVAVGDDVSYSTDGGQTWTTATTPPSNNMGGVAFGNGRFVAVGGNGHGAYSDDGGATWTDTSHNNGNIFDVAFGNNTFVAVGLSGVASHSADGINWTTSNHNNAQMRSVAFGNGVFVAVGAGSSSTENFTRSTDNGNTWSIITEPTSGNTGSVTFGNGRFVTVGFGRAYYSSDDGVSWVRDDPSVTLNAVAFGDNRFVGVGDSDGAYSTDGTNWVTSQPHNNPQQAAIAFELAEMTSATITAVKDSFLRSGNANRNEGANPRLRVRSSGKNRALVGFDQTAIDDFINSSGLTKATLNVTIAENANNWGKNSDRTVDAHPLLEDFAEGNGQNAGVPGSESTRGDGPGVTWKCAEDAEISNQATDCDPKWNGGNFGPATADPQLHVNGQLGDVSWDVTDDVIAGASSWLIKKTAEGQNGKVLYYSREGADDAGDPALAPRLILEN